MWKSATKLKSIHCCGLKDAPLCDKYVKVYASDAFSRPVCRNLELCKGVRYFFSNIYQNIELCSARACSLPTGHVLRFILVCMGCMCQETVFSRHNSYVISMLLKIITGKTNYFLYNFNYKSLTGNHKNRMQENYSNNFEHGFKQGKRGWMQIEKRFLNMLSFGVVNTKIQGWTKFLRSSLCVCVHNRHWSKYLVLVIQASSVAFLDIILERRKCLWKQYNV